MTDAINRVALAKAFLAEMSRRGVASLTDDALQYHLALLLKPEGHPTIRVETPDAPRSCEASPSTPGVPDPDPLRKPEQRRVANSIRERDGLPPFLDPETLAELLAEAAGVIRDLDPSPFAAAFTKRALAALNRANESCVAALLAEAADFVEGAPWKPGGRSLRDRLLDASRAPAPRSNEAQKKPAIVGENGDRRHTLKTWPFPFEDVKAGLKPFEYRPFDRDFRVGDILVLEKWEPTTQRYLGAIERRRVTYLLPGGTFGVPEGYCVMGLADAPRSDEALPKDPILAEIVETMDLEDVAAPEVELRAFLLAFQDDNDESMRRHAVNFAMATTRQNAAEGSDEASPMRPERLPLVCVACRDTEGRVWSLPKPFRHHHVLRVMHDLGAKHAEGGHVNQGFLDSAGRYLNRKQAHVNADVNNQIKGGQIIGGVLTSEDLW